MSASKVYFTDMRCPVGTGLLDKLKKLIEKAGIDSIDMDSKFVAIKIHFGEPGNLSFLRPNFAKVVADKVTSLGGRPFLTDCNTLYVGRRKHALEHLAAAQENGFSPLSTGCQMIIADGLKGTDEMEVPLEGCDHFQSAFIGRAIMDADIFISLTHFKGHELTGFGGAIKNIGMGCGSRAGKMAMHSIGKPSIDAEKCRGCKTCTHYCAQSAISIGEDHKARIDHDLCAGCGRCIGVCNFDAISNAFDAESSILNERMAEYTKAVIQNRPHFHVSIVNQVSPYCDCHAENDAAVVPDIGMFASFDPVALDHACIDAVNAAPAISTSVLGQCAHEHNDHFTDIHPKTNWRSQIEHAQKIGIGNVDYECTEMRKTRGNRRDKRGRGWTLWDGFVQWHYTKQGGEVREFFPPERKKEGPWWPLFFIVYGSGCLVGGCVELERLPRCEHDATPRRDVDGLPGLGIASGAGSVVLDAERSPAGEDDAAALFHFVAQDLQQSIEVELRPDVGVAGTLGHSLGEFVLVHGVLLVRCGLPHRGSGFAAAL